jgi:putative peptidoglycan lipid II flippase
VITPGFYAREDTRTPVKTAVIVLAANIGLNFALIPWLGIYGLAIAIAACSWLNCIMLYWILRGRGHFRIEWWLWSRIIRQLLAGMAMVAALVGLKLLFGDWFAGSAGQRMVAVAAMVGTGFLVYFPAAWLIGGMDKEDILVLLRRKKAVV